MNHNKKSPFASKLALFNTAVVIKGDGDSDTTSIEAHLQSK